MFVSQFTVLNDEKHWENPHEFRPERFCSEGVFGKKKPKAYIPFGVGRRVCVGEKYAMTDLFFMLVVFLQKTRDYEIVLTSHSGLEPDSKQFYEFTPKHLK